MWYFVRGVFILAIISNSVIGFSQPGTPSISALKFLGQYEIPYNTTFKETVVGGISGIDFDATQNVYYLISDDRSEKNNARFYTARINLSERGIEKVDMVAVTTILLPDGRPYPGVKINPMLTPDPESIRYNASMNELIWSSEGDREYGEDTILVHPTIQRMERNGKYKSAIVLPDNLHMSAQEKGPRKNGALEGICFSHDFTTLYACLEEPLYQDGPEASTEETNSLVRIYEFSMTSEANTAQYAYKLDRIAQVGDGFKINGVSEILYVGKDKLLTVERSYTTGLPLVIKVFAVDFSEADNIIHCGSLVETPPQHITSKTLLLNMNDLGIAIDNIEGITWGPTLSNGHRTLVFVADNNFRDSGINQFLLFEVLP